MDNFVEDEFQIQSGSDEFEAGLGYVQDAQENKSAKRKKYHRHTTHQIQELENAFKENPHPDEKARLDLGNILGLESKQVKFWFQNRRTQVKTQVGRHENSTLKQENEKLRMENMAMKELLKNPICNRCGGSGIIGETSTEEHHLVVENARLKDELNRLGHLASCRTNGYLPPPVHNSGLGLSVGQGGPNNSLGVGSTTLLDNGNSASKTSCVIPNEGHDINMIGVEVWQRNKSMFVELADNAMDELIKLSKHDGPLWLRNLQGNGESLDVDEYMKLFPLTKHTNLVSQGTRTSEIVRIENLALIEAFLDTERWIQLFPLSIGRASTIDVFFAGIRGNRNCAMQLMEAEFQVTCPMIPVRQVKFVRYCKQQTQNTWALVDVSVDTISDTAARKDSFNFRRFPSGWIVETMMNGHSKVTWIEHIEYDENFIHEIYQPSVRSGMVFGAHKWLTDLKRQCEIVCCIKSISLTGNYAGCTPNGRKSITKLAMRMMRSFATGICSTVYNWELLRMENDTKFMIRESRGHLGEPAGMILNAISTIWMHVQPQLLYEFLQNENNRVFWDIFTHDGPMLKMLQIPKTLVPSYSKTTLLRGSANDDHVVILQDTSTDAFGAYLVQASLDPTSTKSILSGDDSAKVAILPSGFVIVPGHFPMSAGEKKGEGSSTSQEKKPKKQQGSLLTLNFQILAGNEPTSKPPLEAVETIKKLITHTVNGIKNGLHERH